MNRRRFVAAAAAGAVGVSAGCLSDLIDDATTFEASPIRVSEDAAGEAGYEYQGTEELVEEREFAGESVEVTNYITEYTRTIELPLEAFGSDTKAGVFALVSTPQVSVAGEEFNPVGEMSKAELVDYLQGQYEGLEVGDNVGGRAITKDEIDGLDAAVRFDTWEGAATLQGETEVDVYVDVARAEHGGDHVVVVAVYPDDENVPMESEQDRADTMTAGIQHGDDVDVELEDGDE
ncbi:hypothetical protein HT576_13865 [Haloterrigena sp. SYSU A121-1]|uniref:Uncharacterized protein n=1 Tax=Haloterrigena gelatinilytica TaxID=2741724 RepID=A0A8J8GLB1_9EURY|nr:DUF6517 family protein [Haloterrigena gelatinilytica]NUB92104.1 hypothetical protein [Haloterrigena gelatinilytica]